VSTIEAADYTWRDEAGGEAAARRCLAFLSRIGIEVGPLEEGKPQFLDGLAINRGRLLIDPTVPVWPGDLLHEAGHIALADPDQRPTLDLIAADGGDEMGAIAWSYAAALACDLPLDQLFHDGGYRGGSQSLREAFASGAYVGAPMLGYWGLCDPDRQAGGQPFPQMKRWLR
jgi:hypothetical protein